MNRFCFGWNVLVTSLVSGKQPPSNKRRTFGEKNLVSFGTFPYALCNLTFTNKLLVKGHNTKKKKEKTCKP